MAESKIEWTGFTWNPTVGCSKKSTGCKNCYAISMSHRHASNPMLKGLYEGTTYINKAGEVDFTGLLRLNEKALLQPLKRKKPTIYFVNSMSDLFHENVPFEWIDKVFAVMALCPQHTFQILTKRPDRMLEYFDYLRDYEIHNYCEELIIQNYLPLNIKDIQKRRLPLPNVLLGTSIENQTQHHKRLGDLLEVPAAKRFLSIEPMIGIVDIDNSALKNVDWIIVGGESGHGSRPIHPDWVRKIRNQCIETNTPFFFKQWGQFGYYTQSELKELFDKGIIKSYPAISLFHRKLLDVKEDSCFREVKDDSRVLKLCFEKGKDEPRLVLKLSKKLTGNTLDGEVWQQIPTI